MAWNSDATRFKSTTLTNLDCGNYLKIPQGEGVKRLVGVYDGDLEVGQCAAMVRIPANGIIAGGRLSFTPATGVLLAVGDPYACARFVGPIFTTGAAQVGLAGNLNGTDCATFMRVGRVGDGCGIGYQYTCETDIFVTNIPGENYANLGGWAGGTVHAGGSIASTKWTGGRIVLVVDVLVP